jgi:Zn-dependent peptidase ImmA (M78 family)
MAHTVRGTVNYFLQRRIELDLRILSDSARAVCKDGATSVLKSSVTPRSIRAGGGLDRVTARIYIRLDANKNLARVCIAHEIYHLLKELDAYISRGRTAWLQIPPSRELESECNVFAWRICFYHDRFNNDDELRKKHVSFPPELFVKTFNMTNIRNLEEWAMGVELDPTHPFVELDAPSWINEIPTNEAIVGDGKIAVSRPNTAQPPQGN